MITLLLTLLLLASALPMHLLSAQAFSARKSTPSRKDSHYYSGANPFYAGGYLNECTWYVWGRAYEALGAKPKLSTSAAHHWYQENSRTKAYACGSKPKVGAVMVTKKDGSHGHVAFVEEIYDNGTMLISEYNYNVRGGFSTQVIKQLPAGARRGRAHKVLGYIYVTEAKPAETSAPQNRAEEAKKENAAQTAADASNKTEAGKAATGSAQNREETAAARFPTWLTERLGSDPIWRDATVSAEPDPWKRPVSKPEQEPETTPSFWKITNVLALDVAQDSPLQTA